MGRTFKVRTQTQYHWISNQLLRFAIQQKNIAAQIESGASVEGPKQTIHLSCCVSSLFMVVAFLEAAINELIYHPSILITRNQSIETLIRALSKYERKFRALEKFQFCADLFGMPFDEGKSPYQELVPLFELRNMYAHYIPIGVVIDFDTMQPVDAQQIEKKLRSYKIQLNPLWSKGTPYFPYRCLSASMCEWAICAAITFIKDFHKRVKLDTKWFNDFIENAKVG